MTLFQWAYCNGLITMCFYNELIKLRLLQSAYCNELITMSLLDWAYYSELAAVSLMQRAYYNELITLSLLQWAYFSELITIGLLQWAYYNEKEKEGGWRRKKEEEGREGGSLHGPKIWAHFDSPPPDSIPSPRIRVPPQTLLSPCSNELIRMS